MAKEPKKNKSSAKQSFWRQVWRRFKKSKLGMLGLAITATFVLVGFFAPVLASDLPLICKYDGETYAPAVKDLVHANLPWLGKKLFPQSNPFDQVTFDFRRSRNGERGDWAIWTPVPYGPNRNTPGAVLETPSSAHPLGTDGTGRDLLARMIHGSRVSMLVGFVSVGISTLIGLVLGALAGYFGGFVDFIISRLIEIVLCFPVFFLILTILAMRPDPSIWMVMFVIGVVRWTGTARYVRGEFIRLRDSEYSMAAVALGAGPTRVIFRHILPNALAPVFVTVTFGIAAAIILEASLSYLGVGVQPPDPSWGNILRAGFPNIFNYPYMIIWPSICVFLGVLSYNLVGDTLRDAIDPRLART